MKVATSWLYALTNRDTLDKHAHANSHFPSKNTINNPVTHRLTHTQWNALLRSNVKYARKRRCVTHGVLRCQPIGERARARTAASISALETGTGEGPGLEPGAGIRVGISFQYIEPVLHPVAAAAHYRSAGRQPREFLRKDRRKC